MFRADVKAFTKAGKEVPGTGGSYCESFEKAKQIIARKISGMRRRGYFADVVRFEIEIQEDNLCYAGRNLRYAIEVK